jgi:hypothetical protein
MLSLRRHQSSSSEEGSGRAINDNDEDDDSWASPKKKQLTLSELGRLRGSTTCGARSSRGGGI